MLGGDLRRDTDWNDALPVHVQVLNTLRFYAVGKCINLCSLNFTNCILYICPFVVVVVVVLSSEGIYNQSLWDHP